MPKYIKERDSYWEWDQKRMRLHNFRGGWHNIDENSPDWISAVTIEANDWHDLYKKTGYNPLEASVDDRCSWLDPDGNFWEGEAHEVCAEDILELAYGIEVDSMHAAADELIERGWVKLSATLMLQHYCESGMYDNITMDQWRAIQEWCDAWGVSPSWFNPNYYDDM